MFSPPIPQFTPSDDNRRVGDSAARVADLLIERRANIATIYQLQQALAEANELIAELTGAK